MCTLNLNIRNIFQPNRKIWLSTENPFITFEFNCQKRRAVVYNTYFSIRVDFLIYYFRYSLEIWSVSQNMFRRSLLVSHLSIKNLCAIHSLEYPMCFIYDIKSKKSSHGIYRGSYNVLKVIIQVPQSIFNLSNVFWQSKEQKNMKFRRIPFNFSR